MKERADKLLMERGLAETRQKAQALVLAGQVFADGKRVDKAGRQVGADARLEVRAGPPYVSRAGIKLEQALRDFQVSPLDKVCLDLGASTGGFTDCLLKHGARKVFAVDVGRGQLDWSLRRDPRVISLEGVNVRYLDSRRLEVAEPIGLVTLDLSFISLTKVLPAVYAFLESCAAGTSPVDVLALIKPQFEVGKGQVGKGGIVQDPEKHRQVIQKIERHVREQGYTARGVRESALPGMEGNKEFFIHLVFNARKPKTLKPET